MSTVVAGSSRRALFLICGLLMLAGLVLPRGAAAAYEFDIASFGGEAVDDAGNRVTQAASHPTFINEFEITTGADALPAASVKDVRVDLPPGLIVNPSATSTCSQAELSGAEMLPEPNQLALCPGSSQVGTLTIVMNVGGGNVFGIPMPLYNIEVGANEAPRLATNLSGVIVNVEAEVRTGGDYGISGFSLDTSQTLPLQGAKVTLWGVPADSVNDPLRICGQAHTVVQGCPAGAGRRPLVSYPSNCAGGPLETSIAVNSWENPAEVRTASFEKDTKGDPMAVTGCDNVNFTPTLSFDPESRAAASPTGVAVTLKIPQSVDPDGLSTALLKDASVTLPKGFTINPASADGLQACTSQQIGLSDGSDPACPESAKLGTVEVETPLLETPLRGSVYQAAQADNPFNSLLALYVVAQGNEQTIKLAGEITADPDSGQLKVVFRDNPRLPFETLTMRLKGGSRAPLVTPSACGTYTTQAEFASWSQPNRWVSSPSRFTIDQSCDLASQFRPGFEAGMRNPTAGAHSPFALRVTRPDGQQNLARIEATLPEGLSATLKGVPLCPEASAPSSDCPAASQVGTTTVGAGAGASPLYVPQAGKAPTAAYLAGPYGGAPYSLVVKVPAQAGPFDLGTVAVRNALHVDPVTAQVTAKSDPLPQILQGVPIAYRDVRVDVDRSGFALNPTSCDPMSVESTITSAQGAIANPSSRFQVANCERLAFKPKLSLKVSGGMKRGDYPKLRAVLKAKPGEANIGKVSVALPHSEFLAQSHIRTICTRVQYAADACPAGSIYGKGRAFTPLLDQPLEGPVYLRSSNNPLPDLVIALKGQIEVDLVGRIDQVNGGIRNTFETVPDAPVSKFVLTMQGGKKGLLENSRNLCKGAARATVRMDGQNGKAHDARPVLSNSCGKTRKKGQRR